MRFGAELPDVLARARAAGVTRLTVIGTRAADSEAAAELAAREPGIVAAAGIHPNDVAEIDADEWERIERLAAAGRVAAIGETGLDWYRTTAPPELQREYFDRHLRLAQRLALPVVIHTRESIRDTLDMLREAAARGPLRPILHSFTGTAAEAAEAVDLGCHLGFAGMVTFRSSAALREVAKAVPLDRLLVETDSPFLSPEPLRGKRNEPANVVHTASCLALARGEPLDAFAAATTANACRVFGAPGGACAVSRGWWLRDPRGTARIQAAPPRLCDQQPAVAPHLDDACRSAVVRPNLVSFLGAISWQQWHSPLRNPRANLPKCRSISGPSAMSRLRSTWPLAGFVTVICRCSTTPGA
jgi:TatD DNase family protein